MTVLLEIQFELGSLATSLFESCRAFGRWPSPFVHLTQCRLVAMYGQGSLDATVSVGMICHSPTAIRSRWQCHSITAQHFALLCSNTTTQHSRAQPSTVSCSLQRPQPHKFYRIDGQVLEKVGVAFILAYILSLNKRTMSRFMLSVQAYESNGHALPCTPEHLALCSP